MKSTVLIFKFDGILINTVEIVLRRIWQIISNFNLLSDSLDVSKIDHLVVMNWDNGPKFLARIICAELGAQDQATKFERELINLEYRMAADFRLNQERLRMILRLSNAEFLIAVHTKRDLVTLQHISRVVGLDLSKFDCILTPSDSLHLLREKYGDANLVYFGNTISDSQLNTLDGIVIMPEFNKEEQLEEDYLVHYLEKNFLQERIFEHA